MNAADRSPAQGDCPDATRHYIGGRWHDSVGNGRTPLVDPATGLAFAEVAIGAVEDVDRAVAAARAALERWRETPLADRLALLERFCEIYEQRVEAVAQALSREMGAAITLARTLQAPRGHLHVRATIEAARAFAFEVQEGNCRVVHEPVGVCALITPWNWPLNQIACKVAPALAAGCTMVLKPSEIAPHCAVLFAEALHDAGVPPGVFNLVQGDGETTGRALARHPEVDMVSFTGSTRAGVSVAIDAAATVKRVAQELGGKSPNLLLPDADFAFAAQRGLASCMLNAGQSCSAPTRMLVDAQNHERLLELLGAAVDQLVVGAPSDPATIIGPVVSERQFARVQGLIERAIAAGARVVRGGPGRPDGFTRGWYVRPTVLADVTPDSEIVREEVFGPVLVVQRYRDLDEAVALANDTPYGLAAYVQSADREQARAVARRLRAGMVYLNHPASNLQAPFGGVRMSGNGREYGTHGLREYLEIKAVLQD